MSSWNAPNAQSRSQLSRKVGIKALCALAFAIAAGAIAVVASQEVDAGWFDNPLLEDPLARHDEPIARPELVQ